jgi:hypothetical protein
VSLAVLPAYSTTCATSDACSRVGDGHYFAQYFFVVIEPDKIAVIRDSLQGHHGTTADFIATAAANANLLVNVQKIRGLPRSSITRHCLYFNLFRFHLCLPIFQ